MRYLYSILFFLFAAARSSGQEGYTIIYETKARTTDPVIKFLSATLAIHEPLGYCYYPVISGGKSLKENLPLGSSYWPAIAFTNTAACLYMFQYGSADEPKKQRLVTDSCNKSQWTLSAETKIIAGYTCKKATKASNIGDAVAWYATGLPAGFGPFLSHSLPGTVLEYYHEKGMSITTATIVNKGAFKIVEPAYCERVSRTEYDKMHKKQH